MFELYILLPFLLFTLLSLYLLYTNNHSIRHMVKCVGDSFRSSDFGRSKFELYIDLIYCTFF